YRNPVHTKCVDMTIHCCVFDLTNWYDLPGKTIILPLVICCELPAGSVAVNESHPGILISRRRWVVYPNLITFRCVEVFVNNCWTPSCLRISGETYSTAFVSVSC